MASTSDNNEAYQDLLDSYKDHVESLLGLSLYKKPSAEQKSAIVKEIKKQFKAESDIDFDSILEKHARDCYEPLHFTDPVIFSRVEYILQYFLPDGHPIFRDLALNEEDPPLCIRQLLRKPSVEQVAGVIKALKEADPDWNWYDSIEGARKLLLALGHNFPELIKQNSNNNIIFADKLQNSKNKKSPRTRKAKKGKKKSKVIYLFYAFVLAILFLILRSCK